ncbi:hypothetical protein LTS18_009749 [Coniosporium uncinatum]|uniref:Uncharacterized protein n=1 Tax=Coniosporium uncinatum TaxID=93489 RepID=A0ACC3DAF3_9PEZI|nr:hypothetical protein LTS18_009749 [Coniosporium uncinatum]
MFVFLLAALFALAGFFAGSAFAVPISSSLSHTSRSLSAVLIFADGPAITPPPKLNAATLHARDGSDTPAEDVTPGLSGGTTVSAGAMGRIMDPGQEGITMTPGVLGATVELGNYGIVHHPGIIGNTVAAGVYGVTVEIPVSGVEIDAGVYGITQSVPVEGITVGELDIPETTVDAAEGSVSCHQGFVNVKANDRAGATMSVAEEFNAHTAPLPSTTAASPASTVELPRRAATGSLTPASVVYSTVNRSAPTAAGSAEQQPSRSTMYVPSFRTQLVTSTVAMPDETTLEKRQSTDAASSNQSSLKYSTSYSTSWMTSIVTLGVPLSDPTSLAKRQGIATETLVLLKPTSTDEPVPGTTKHDPSPLPGITIMTTLHETVTAINLQGTSFVTKTVRGSKSTNPFVNILPRSQPTLDEDVQVSQTRPHYKLDPSSRAPGPSATVFPGTTVFSIPKITGHTLDEQASPSSTPSTESVTSSRTWYSIALPYYVCTGSIRWCLNEQARSLSHIDTVTPSAAATAVPNSVAQAPESHPLTTTTTTTAAAATTTTTLAAAAVTVPPYPAILPPNLIPDSINLLTRRHAAAAADNTTTITSPTLLLPFTVTAKLPTNPTPNLLDTYISEWAATQTEDPGWVPATASLGGTYVYVVGTVSQFSSPAAQTNGAVMDEDEKMAAHRRKMEEARVGRMHG